MTTTPEHDKRISEMVFATIYPLYVDKIEKKGRTKDELNTVIEWLTGYDVQQIKQLIEDEATFELFFKSAKFNPKTQLIKGVICGYRIEDIETPLTKQVRILDKLVDELAKGRPLDKILRS